MLNISIILISILTIIMLESVGYDFYLPFFKSKVNNTIAFVLIYLYLYFSLSVVWEMKSFVFNLFQAFNFYAGVKASDLIKSQKNKTDDDDISQ